MIPAYAVWVLLAIAAAVHYLLVAKVFLPQPIAFAAVFGVLLAFRIVNWRVSAYKRRALGSA